MFAQQEIVFLRHKVSKNLMKMNERKVQAILDWLLPSKVAELWFFLGLANYYRKFIQGYSKKVFPLTNLLKNDKKWVWTNACQKAFEKLKAAVSSEPVLHLLDFELSFEVHIDAFNGAISGVLVQEKHLVTYESRKLNEARIEMFST